MEEKERKNEIKKHEKIEFITAKNIFILCMNFATIVNYSK